MSIEASHTAKKFNAREIYCYNMINGFYKKCPSDKITKMISIIAGTSNISLRILDWFVTRYSNKHKILITLKDEVIDVHISYKAQLKSYKKKYFDPFKRREKFDFHFRSIGETINTTLGQLNFFRWAIENNIMEYVETNYDLVSKEMNLSNKDDKIRKKEKKSGNKTIVSSNKQYINNDNNIGINVTKKISNEQVKIILTFD